MTPLKPFGQFNQTPQELSTKIDKTVLFQNMMAIALKIENL